MRRTNSAYCHFETERSGVEKSDEESALRSRGQLIGKNDLSLARFLSPAKNVGVRNDNSGICNAGQGFAILGRSDSGNLIPISFAFGISNPERAWVV
jgi:hypothetical protein